MSFLRTLFWIIVVVLILLFADHNWTPITVNLWGDLRMDTKLPVLVIGAFLLGLLPPLIAYHATRWRLRRVTRQPSADIAEPPPVPVRASTP